MEPLPEGWITPECPSCGQPPFLALSGQAFCGSEGCQTFCWNPRISVAENLADLQEIDLFGETHEREA